MSYWKVIVPDTANNYVRNPSAEAANTLYAARGAGVVTRINSLGTPPPYQTMGLWSYLVDCTAGGAGDGIDLDIFQVNSANKIISFHIYCGTQPPPVRVTIDAGANWYTLTTPVLQLSDDWYWYQVLTGTTGVATTELSIEATAVTTFYLDAVMVADAPGSPASNTPMTYIDGDQDGCVWTGTPHASRSKRMNVVRGGGLLYDLQDDLHLDVGIMMGVGAATHNIATEDMALLPGAQIMGEKLARRSFALGGVIRGTSWANFHDNKAELLASLSGQIVPEKNGQKQPVQIWYTGSLPVRYVDAYYESGLEGNMNARNDPCYWEQNVAIQFTAVNPLWRSVIERSCPLDTIDSDPTTYCVASRLQTSDITQTYFGWWTDMQISSITAGAGGNTAIYTAVWGPDGRVYIGGDFTDLDGVAGCDHVASFEPYNNIIYAVGGGLNNIVRSLCFGPDGTLYAGGDFTDAGGDGNADYIAQIDPDAAVPAWSNVGGGPTAGATMTSVNALCFDRAGNLIIGGNFLNWGGDADRDYAVYFDGTNYQEFSSNELNGPVYAVAASPDGWIYFGGAFTDRASSTHLNYICRWKFGDNNFSALNAGGVGLNNTVRALAIDSTGRRVWIGGDFHASTGGVTLNHIGMWNGTTFEAMGSGTTDVVRTLALGPDDALWVGGDWTTITGIGASSGIAKWVGQSWCPVDVQFNAVPNVYCIALSSSLPPTVRNYHVTVGFDATVTMYYPDLTLIQTEGTWLTYPKVIFKRTGAVTGRLGNVRMGPTGSELYLNYTMQLGETLTIDTDPQKKTILSSYWGQRQDALLPPSDLGQFSLLPNWNDMMTDVYWFAEASGDTDLTCYLLWRETFESQD